MLLFLSILWFAPVVSELCVDALYPSQQFSVIRAPPMNVGRVLLFMASPSVRCRGLSNLVIFNRISSKFHIWIAFIQLCFKFGYRFCPTNDNQDAQQNGPRLSACTCKHATLDIYYPIASKFNIWITFIKL